MAFEVVGMHSGFVDVGVLYGNVTFLWQRTIDFGQDSRRDS